MSDYVRAGVFLTPEQLKTVKDEFSLPIIMTGRQYGADLRTGELLMVQPEPPTELK